MWKSRAWLISKFSPVLLLQVSTVPQLTTPTLGIKEGKAALCAQHTYAAGQIKMWEEETGLQFKKSIFI